MKKSKLLIVLPLIALTMSSCDMSLTSGPSGSNNRSSSSEEVNEPSSYSSYLVEYGFYYNGNLESVPEGASLYLYGSLVRDSFTPLTVNEAGNYQTTIYDIEYGTYEYSLYIEYTDKDVSLESPLVYSGLQTVNGNSSSGGNKYIYLDSSLSELLGEEQGGGSGEDTTYTYTIEVDNTEALTTLTYDGNSQTQTSVELQVYLVTTPSEGNPERIPASETDVELSNYSETIISVSGLTVTPIGPGTTSITISKEGYQSAYVEVSVSDITITGNTNQITLYFTFIYETTTQTIPEDAKVFICGNWDDATWSDTNVPTLQYDDTNECYYAVITYDGDEDVMNSHWYTYNLYLAGINDSFSYDNNVKLSTDNLWWSASDYTTPTYTKSETIILSDTFDNLLNESLGGDEETEDQDPYTYISNYTLEITIKDSSGNAKKCDEGYSLWMGSGLNGSWNTAYNGYWDWGETVKLTETVSGDSVTYTYTYSHVAIGATYDYNILYSTATEASSLDWGNTTEGTTGDKLGSDNFTFTVTGTSDSYTESITCTATTTLVDSMLDVSASSGDTGTGGDQGGDTGSGNQGSLNDDGTATVTLNIIMYAPDGTTSLSVPSGCTVYIVGDFDISTDGTYTWWTLDSNNAIQLASSDNGTYLYTYTTNVTPGSTYEFKLLLVEDNATYDWYNYTIYDSTFTVPSGTYNGDTIDLNCTTAYTDLSDAFNTTGGDTGDTGDVYTGDGTLTNDKATINLRITITNPSGNSLEIPSGYTVYIAGDFDLYEGGSTWNVDSTHALTLYSSDNGEYVYTYSASVTPGTTYNYSLLFVDNNGSADWWTYVISSSTFSVPDTYTNGGVLEFKSATEYYDLNNVITSSGTGDEDPNQGGDTGVTNSCTLSVSFTDVTTGNTTLEVPDGYTVYLAGTFNVTGTSWNTDLDCYLTRDTTQADKYVYTYEFDSLAEGQYTVEFLFCETGTVNWDHSLGQETFSVGSDGTITPSSITHQTSYDSLSDVIKPAGEDTTVYILILDTTSTAASSVNTTAVWNSDDGKGYFNGSDTCASTVTTAGNGVSCVYNSVAATIKANTSAWFTLANIDSTINWTDQIGTNTIEIPEVTTGNIAVYVCQSELNRLGVYTGSWDSYAVSNGEWITSYSDLSYVISNISSIYNH